MARPAMRTVLAAATASLALAGCGLQQAAAPQGAALLVTQGFGAHTILSTSSPKLAASDTLLRLLERNATVTTTAAGAVASIDHVTASAAAAAATPTAWSFFVNGVAGKKRAAKTKLHSGDHVWWDRHDTAASTHIPAIVGAYPEPFLDGYGGHRYPTRVECSQTGAKACTSVYDAIAGYGIPDALGCFECAEYNASLRVLVGPYATIRTDAAANELAAGPATSGVYARFIDAGHKLELLDAAGHVTQTLGAGSGLVAATRWAGEPPVWFVTGTDAAGVAAAAQAFTAGTLDGHYAVAVANDIAEPLPLARATP